MTEEQDRPDAERLLTLDEAAELFSVSRRKLFELVRERHPRVIRAGRAILFDRRALNDLTDAMRDKSPGPPVRTVSRLSRALGDETAQERVAAMLARKLTKPKR